MSFRCKERRQVRRGMPPFYHRQIESPLYSCREVMKLGGMIPAGHWPYLRAWTGVRRRRKERRQVRCPASFHSFRFFFSCVGGCRDGYPSWSPCVGPLFHHCKMRASMQARITLACVQAHQTRTRALGPNCAHIDAST